MLGSIIPVISSLAYNICKKHPEYRPESNASVDVILLCGVYSFSKMKMRLAKKKFLCSVIMSNSITLYLLMEAILKKIHVVSGIQQMVYED